MFTSQLNIEIHLHFCTSNFCFRFQ